MSETIVVVGSGGVGKSAVTLRFIRDEFIAIYEPTVEDAYRKHVETDGYIGIVEVIDTAGTEQFKSMRDLYYKNSDGFLLVCSVDSPSSFDEVCEIRDQILRVKNQENIPVVLAINKTDLPKDQWILNIDAVTQTCKKWKTKVFMTSAKENENVNEIFTNLISQTRNNNKSLNSQSQKKKKKTCPLL
mmetsp:Transcript_34740/g.59551  ORF Transcript_34740/g.59551 Transcript_34740/m.59551 type:complete len:187 (-) Transcript_34740:3-563(-)